MASLIIDIVSLHNSACFLKLERGFCLFVGSIHHSPYNRLIISSMSLFLSLILSPTNTSILFVTSSLKEVCFDCLGCLFSCANISILFGFPRENISSSGMVCVLFMSRLSFHLLQHMLSPFSIGSRCYGFCRHCGCFNKPMCKGMAIQVVVKKAPELDSMSMPWQRNTHKRFLI